MTAEREAHLRSLGWLGSFEAREVWALVDEARAQNVVPQCAHAWVHDSRGVRCFKCEAVK